mmetsp:Transcript_8300/g.12071  ORF Transcript_8300/g.12071 Transcript_8300/m.12071 type:complete len:223 (+) Transcript_8300:126-794(+)
MKTTILTLSLIASYASAFSRGLTFIQNRRIATELYSLGNDPNVILGGNSGWKPEPGGMKSTDTGDYFPEGYSPDIAFTEGMMGSQGGGKGKLPDLPGMENLGADAIMMGGIEEATEIPAGMQFIPSSVPDFNINMQVAASGSAHTEVISVKPVCMSFEDFYAAFSTDSHKCFSVSPQCGRMDRRGGEPTVLKVKVDPRGQAGNFVGDLVINLPGKCSIIDVT